MKKNPLRRGLMAALATAALVTSTLSAGAAQAADETPTGQLTVKLVDTLGRPVLGSVLGLPGSTGESFSLPSSPDGAAAAASSYRATVSPGSYGLVVMAPWGGLVCAGVAPCIVPGLDGDMEAPTVTPVVSVTDGGSTVYTVKVPLPATISGSSRIGSTLKTTLSASQQRFFEIYRTAPGIGSWIASPTVQWRRDGVAIPGATAMTYRLTSQDASRRIDAVLDYPEILKLLINGWASPTYAVPGLRAGKASTRTTADLFRKRIKAGRRTGMRIDVTTDGAPVAAGRVRVTVGRWNVVKEVRNGSARATLPARLKPGRHKIVVTYLGSGAYLTSKARKLVLTVVR